MSFSEDFLWGGDISAAQIEGAWDQGGKSPTEPDYYLGSTKDAMRFAYYRTADGEIGKVLQYSGQLPEGAQYIIKEGEFYPNHVASDFYYHYKEDIKLLGEMGFKALNLTISWARILPAGIKGGPNQEGIDYYTSVFKELKKYNIKPIVTMYKYDMPAFYVTDLGGWSNRQLIDEYVEFNRICMEAFQDFVEYWVTFNEINILKLFLDINSNVTQEDRQRVFEETHNQFIAAAKVVKLGHELNAKFKIGGMVAGVTVYPLTSDPKDNLAAQKSLQDNFFFFGDIFVRGYYPSFAKRVFDQYQVFLDVSEEDAQILKEGKSDFLATSYYATNCITTHPELIDEVHGNLTFGVKNPYLSITEWGWQIDPEGLKYNLHAIYDRYQVPILIVENGIGAIDQLESDYSIHDDYRIAYHKQHIEKMAEAVAEGVDLIGYTTWSCIDLVSFSTGEFRKRYGMIYVDMNDDGTGTQKRYKKDSFYWYKKVIATNGREL